MAYALLGEHLSHSLSVPVHRKIREKAGLPSDYVLREIPRERFEKDIAGILREYEGVNVTIPYKQDVIPYLDELSPEAEAVGAVNTVVREGDRLKGYNTDIRGFQVMLEEAGVPGGIPVWILGTGGASVAVRRALTESGFTEIHSVSRDPAKGEPYSSLDSHFSGLLVNCTPVGMYPDAESCPLTAETLNKILPRARAVLDLIYNPVKTVLLKAAEDRGIPAVNGMVMLTAQAIASEALWNKASDAGLSYSVVLVKGNQEASICAK